MRWVIVVLLLLAMSSWAFAEPDNYETKASMEDYYDGESYGGYILNGMGVLGFVGGGFLYTDGGERERGASYVAFGIGGVHFAAGVYINIASVLRKRRLNAEPVATWGARERARMLKVERQLFILKIVEGGLIVSGATMALVGNKSDRPKLEGVGYAIAAEAAMTLLFDIAASRRACRYRRALFPYASSNTVGLTVQF